MARFARNSTRYNGAGRQLHGLPRCLSVLMLWRQIMSNKSRAKDSAENFVWDEKAGLWANRKNHRFISHPHAASLGLKIPAPVQTQAAPAPAAQPVATQPTPAPAQEAPAQPAAVGAPPPPIQTVADTEIFSNAPAPDPIPGEAPPEAPPDTAQPPPGTPPPVQPSKGLNRAMAIMVWSMIVRLSATIFGEGMLPRIYKTDAGDIDENENVILAFCTYFDSIGIVNLSPLWNLILTVAAYFLVRIEIILMWFKSRRAKRAQKPDGESSAKPEAKEPTRQPTPAPAPEAQPENQAPPTKPAPASEPVIEIETDSYT